MLLNLNKFLKLERKFYLHRNNSKQIKSVKDICSINTIDNKFNNVNKNSCHFEKNHDRKQFFNNDFNKLFFNIPNKHFSLGYRAEDLDAKPIQKNKYDNIKLSFGREARNNLLEGIKTMADNVAITYGPLGKNVIIDYEDAPIVTKDGVTVAKHINLRNRQKNIGCRLLSIIAGNTNEFAGDGTTTATVLAGELSKIGISMVNNDYHPIDIKRGIELAGKMFLEFLEKTKKKVSKKEDIFNLAMITTNKDKIISEIITESLIKTGLNGFLNIEESPTGLTELLVNKILSINFIKILEGVTLTNGLPTKEFLNENEETVELKDCLILICNESINNFEYLVRILEFAKNTNKSLIVFSPKISQEVTSMFVFNKRKNNLNCVCINVPDYLEDHSNLSILEDVSIMTGAKLCRLDDLICDDDSFIPEEIFGSSKRATISEYETILTGTKGNKDEIKERLNNLKSKIKDEENKNIKEVLKKRLSNLEGKTAIIAVGGFTESEVGENRDKIIDCLNSCKSAMESGILPGGGTSFIHGIRVLEERLKEYKNDEKLFKENHRINYDSIVGISVFIEALKSTIRVLFKNSKVSSNFAIDRILNHNIKAIENLNTNQNQFSDNPKIHDNYNFNKGFDIVSQEYFDDMIEKGIIDSYNTIKCSVEDAISVTGLIVTTECIVYKEIDYDPPPLEYFKNKFKSDPMARKEAMEKFYGEDRDDFENFSKAI